MDLSPGERVALQNLAKKAHGEPVDWINIADARSLSDKGLAARDRQGWQITPPGSAWLEAAPAAPLQAHSEPPQQLHPDIAFKPKP